ncbi:MAG: DVUA0089 family protein [Pseudomonadota bacterium]
MSKLTLSAVGALVALGTASAASAVPFIESGDAGQTLDTAQIITSDFDSIEGTLAEGTDTADIFTFAFAGGTFTAETTSALFDTELFLFAEDGTFLAGDDDGAPDINICDDDDGSPTPLCSLISIDLDAGIYSLGISTFNSTASDGILNAGAGPITAPGSYTILVSGDGIDVPAPGALALFGLGILGLGLRRSR